MSDTLKEATVAFHEPTPDRDILAFPSRLSEGMKLRDYFAAKAMQALLSQPLDEVLHAANTVEKGMNEFISWTAYQVADAMMSERSK